MDLREISSGIDPEQHWYYRTKKRPLIDFADEILRGRAEPLNIVDIGAGSGFFSESLSSRFGRKVGDVIRVDAAYERDSAGEDRRISGRSLWRTTPPDRIEDSIVILMDVLEHVERDEEFLRSIVTRCAGRNHFFITAPAFQGLWSGHDVFLKHYRRYTLGRLERLALGAGLAPTAAYYLYGAILPPVWVVRKLAPGRQSAAGSDLKRTGVLSNKILEWICLAEFPFRRWNKLAGLSCVVEAVAE